MLQVQGDVATVKQMVAQILSSEYTLQAADTQKLTSTNSSFAGFNYNWYYNVVIVLVGTVTADVEVQLGVVMKQIGATISHYYLNGTIQGWRIQGVKLNNINVVTTNLGSGTVYVSYVGYSQPTSTDTLDMLV